MTFDGKQTPLWLQRWENLPASTRRKIFIGVIAAAVIGLLYFFVSSGNTRKRVVRPSRNDITREIFTGGSGRDLNLHGLAADVKSLQAENMKLKKKLDAVVGKQVNSADAQAQEIQKQKVMQDRAAQEALILFQKKYGAQLKALTSRPKKAPAPTPAAVPEAPSKPAKFQAGAPLNNAMTANDVDWSEKGGPVSTHGKGAAVKKTAPVKMRTVIDKEEAAAEKAAAKAGPEGKKKAKDVFIPAGSIFSGTLITGLDAPTGTAAKKSPYPVLLRVKKEAILPNRFRADVRECFLIASGYGDLSSERVYLRGETISCVRNDGGVIESPIDMYGVGEDGRAGVRGELKTKQGQFLASAMAAGFLESVSSVFTSSPVPTLSTTNSSTTPFQQVFSAKSAQSAAVKGMGDAMNRLANFYIDMAQSVFPIIQVNAGRQIDFIMTKGTSLKLR